MWPRVVEVMFGSWLVISPFVFRDTPELERYTFSMVISGTLIAIASTLAFWSPAAGARYLTLLTSLWLMAHGYFAAARPGPPAAQNELFAVLPNEINRPPAAWQK
jgi:uncharacterized membrane protein HdeD (DUF308 family)